MNKTNTCDVNLKKRNKCITTSFVRILNCNFVVMCFYQEQFLLSNTFPIKVLKMGILCTNILLK